MFLVRFWGVRGSIPVPGSTTVEMGGNTTCVEVRVGSEIIIFDAGTGIRELGCELMAELPVAVKLFFTHVHWDHVQGFPFFAPAFVKGNRFDLYGAGQVTTSLAEILSGQMEFPNFPVSLDVMGSRMDFHDLHEGQVISVGSSAVTNANLNHPGGVIAYRVDYEGHSLVFATDTEHYSCLDDRLVALARGADVLIYDAMYTPEEYAGEVGDGPKTGWGHSTWEEGIKVARAAGVRSLVLTHHDPDHDDDQVRAIEAAAQEAFPDVAAAHEGMVLELS